MRVCSYMHALLIIGAGGHGQVVAEVASACGYDKIDFLDDQNKCAIGKIKEFDKYLDQYKEAFVVLATILYERSYYGNCVIPDIKFQL